MTKLAWCSLLLLLCCCKLLFAQNCTLSGHAQLADQSQKDGIMVQLLDTTATKLIHFRTTDSTGYFNFGNVKKGFYKLYVTQFGYSDTMLLIRCNDPMIQVDPLILTPLSVNIMGVSVIEKALMQRKSGDTTIFNLKIVETGAEQSVTDIIHKIPGFSVEGSKYFFQNKPIENILINGRDISDNNQVEFTDGILYKTIDDVRIIENYSNAYQPYTNEKAPGIAMDINMKAKYRGKFQGTFNLKGGYKNIYDVLASTIKADQKNALKIAISSSNSGKDIQEFDQSSFIRKEVNDLLFNNKKHQLLSQTNKNTVLEKSATNYFRQTVHFLKIHVDNKLSDRSRWKSQLTINQLNGRQDINSVRQFASNLSTQGFSRIGNQDIWRAMLDNSLSISFNSSTNLEIEIPTSYTQNTGYTQEEGAFIGSSYQNNSSSSEKSATIEPLYKFHKTFSNQITLSIFGVNRYQKNLNRLNITSRDSIAGYAIFDMPENLFKADQTHNYLSNNFNNQIRLRKKVLDFEIQYNLSYENNIEKLSNSSQYIDNEPFAGVQALRFSSLTHSLRVMYDKRPFRIAAGMIYAISRLRADEDENKSAFIRPGLFAMYRLNTKWNISASSSVKIYQPVLAQITNLQTLQDQLSVWNGGVGIQEVSIIETYNFSLFKEFEIGEEASLFNTSFSFNPKFSEIQPVYDFDFFYQTLSHQLINRGNQFSFLLFYDRKYRIWNYRIDLTASKSAIEMKENLVRDDAVSLKFGLNYYEIKRLKIQSDVSIRLLNRSNGASQAVNLYLNPRISVDYTKNLFQGKVSYQLIYNEINRAKNAYHLLSCEFVRKKVLKKFEISIKLFDILNLKPNTITATTFNQIFLQTNTYRILPGQILAGLKWYIG